MRRTLALWIVALGVIFPFPAEAAVFLDEAGPEDGVEILIAGSSEGAPRRYLQVGDMLLTTGESGFSGRRWTGGRVYYDFAADVTEENRDRFEAAAQEWEDEVNLLAGRPLLQFELRANEANYIHVFNGTKNSAAVGMQGGDQPLQILNWSSRRVILHEIGHALGLAHEHQRSDRDAYVQIFEENIQDAYKYAFQVQSTTAFGEYDFLSVMHYSSKAFSKNNQPTILPRPAYAEYEDLLGNYGCGSSVPCLTEADLNGMVRRYSESVDADSSCTFTASPSGWIERDRVYYRLVLDQTWLFVPTGRIQIQPIDFTFDRDGLVQVETSSSEIVDLYGDPDLTSPLGTRVRYEAGSGFLDYWFWLDFEANTVSTVKLVHTPSIGDPNEILYWTVGVQCDAPAGLTVAPTSTFESSGTVGGPFTPTSRTYGLTNSGSTSVSYTLSVSYASTSATGWLSLSRSSGSLSAGQSGNFAATINSSATGLGEGTHQATITLRTTGSNPQTITRAVALSVQPGTSLPPVISGRITTADGSPLEGVRMGGMPSVQWTDDNGEYSVYVGEGWSGTVRPSKAGFNFSPQDRTYSAVETGLSGQNYTGTAKTYVIAGRVTLDGAGLPGVTLTGLPGGPVTDADGNYTATLPFQWSGTVTPSAPGFAFAPGSRTYSEIGMDRVEESYTATRQTVTLSGRVTSGGAGLAGVWLNGLPGSVVTAADGTYAAAVPYGWSGTAIPGAGGYVFNPASRTYTNLVNDFPGLDFTASQAPPGSGRLWIVATSAELNYAATLSRSGDMILVKPGTYLGADPGGLDPGTVLVAEAGPDQTILEVTEFRINMNDVVIDGFTFRNTIDYEPVHVAGSTNVRLRNCRFIASAGNYGVRVTNAQNVLIEGSVFSGEGGVLLRSGTSSGTLTLRNNHFIGHTVGFSGGSNPSLQVILENNLFRNNTRDAVDVNGLGSLLTRNNLFTGNFSALDVASIAGSVQLTHDTFVQNGTAYDISGTISVLIYNSILQGNNRGIDGGSYATISVHHLMHWQNTSWLYGSANYILDESTIWETDPRFVNYAAGDYRLASNSPARGIGQGGVDLGAYGGALGGAWKTPPGTPQPAPALLGIVITGQDRINPGETLALTAKAEFANGYSSPYTTFTSVAQWSSSDPSVLALQTAGRFLAVRPGTAVVTARSGTVTQTLPVTVLAPDLVLIAAETTEPVPAGGVVIYQLSCTNRGPGIARNVQIIAQYDARTSFASASPAPDSGMSNRWSLGNLQPGETTVVSVTLNVNSAAAGALLSLSASATADFAATASDSETTAVSGTPDLSVQTSLAPTEVRPNGLLSATLTIRNAGSAPAQDVVLEAIYPSGTAYRSAVPAPGSGTGTWFVGGLAPGEQRVFSVELEAAPSASGTLVLTAEIRSSDIDPVPADNQSTASAEILPVVDLEISVTDSPAPVHSGQPVVYDITVTNQGPSTATAVTLTALLPEGLTLDTAIPGQGSCSGDAPVVCQLGSLLAGASVDVSLSATAGTAGTWQMTSSVSGNQEDPAPGDNLATVTTEILPAAAGLDLYTIAPCRILDTRPAAALVSNVPRAVPVAGLCGVPATARAVLLNVTVVAPSGVGYVSLWPADLTQPLTSVVNFSSGQVRSNNAIVALATDEGGDLAVQAFVAGSGTVHLIVDVGGYFQ